MLGNSPKFKYQSLKFKRELAKANAYKRSSLPISQNKFIQFLQTNGLTTRSVKLASLMVFCFFVYIFLLPNFLSIKEIKILGLNETKTEKIQEKINSYIYKNFFVKNNNLLLLSKKGLKNYLETQEEIISVNEIKKNFPNKLTVKLEARTEKYALNYEDKIYIYSNDGKYLFTETGSSSNTSLIRLILKSPYPGMDFKLSKTHLDIFENTENIVFESVKAKILHFEFSPNIDTDVKMVLDNGSYLILDTNTFSNELLNNIKTLYYNLNEEERKKVYYIDLRIKNKAFVCFKGNSCTQPTIVKPKIPENSATSSETSSIKTNSSQ